MWFMIDGNKNVVFGKKEEEIIIATRFKKCWA